MSEHPNDHNSKISEDAIIAVQLSKLKRETASSKTAQGDLKGLQNSLDADGLNVKAASDALKIVEKGKKQKTINYITDLLKYLRVLGQPLEADQLELFQSVPVMPGILEQAYEDGLLAGRTGEDRFSSPHDLNSDSGREWDKGFGVGEKERETVLAMEQEAEIVPAEGEANDDESPDEGQSNVEASIMAAE
ncbi:MAG: hypothetical protein ABJO09_01135 [Hyphomicrobiales bacterium]